MDQQKIPFFTAIFMSVNIMVGVGLYSGSDVITAIAGNASFLAWSVVALLYLPMVYSIAQLARLIPGGGGFYRYACQALGEKIGFMSGWLYYLSYLLAASTVIIAFRRIIGTMFPNVSLFQNHILFLGCVVFIIMLLNLIRLTAIGKIQKFLTVAKITPVLAVIVLMPFFIKTDFSIPAVDMRNLFSSSALTMALFGFLGFEFACNLSNQIQGGAKATAKVVLAAFGITATIFTIFHFGLLHIMGAEGLATYKAAGFAPFVGILFPAFQTPLVWLISIAITLSYFNSSNGILTLGVALLHSVAEDGKIYYSNMLTKLNSEGRPWVVIAINALLIFLFGTLIPNMSLLANSCAFGVVISIAIALLSLLIIQLRNKSYLGIPITLIALGIALFLVITRIQASGVTIGEKIFNLSPIFVGLIVGYLLMKQTNTCHAGPDRTDELLEEGKRRDIAP